MDYLEIILFHICSRTGMHIAPDGWETALHCTIICLTQSCVAAFSVPCHSLELEH